MRGLRLFVTRDWHEEELRKRDVLQKRLETRLERTEKNNEKLLLENASLKSQLGGLERRLTQSAALNDTLSDTLKKYRAVDITIKDFASPIPPGETGRREYMAEVANYYDAVLKDQLNHMSSQFKNQTAMFPLTERETDFFRACVNVIGLLQDWGESCVAEHRANIATVKEQNEVDAFEVEPNDAVENIKRIISE